MHDLDRRDFLRGSTIAAAASTFGLLVPPEEPAALAAAIGHLLEDRDLASRLGSAARRRIYERYTQEHRMRRFEAFYEALL